MLKADAMPVRHWLTHLGLLVAGSMPTEEAKMRIAAFAPMLEDQFPHWSFTAASLQTVARGSRFFPSYAEIAEALSAWVRENRPPPSTPLLAGPRAEAISSEDAVYVATFRRRAAGSSPRRLEFLLSIVRQHYPDGAKRAIEAEFGRNDDRSMRVRPPTLRQMPGADRREAGEPPPPPNPRQSRGGDDW